MSNILFSIVVPTYNREKFIVKTIQSVLSQTYTNFELIIVDDGSTDNTEKLFEKLKINEFNITKKRMRKEEPQEITGQIRQKESISIFLILMI